MMRKMLAVITSVTLLLAVTAIEVPGALAFSGVANDSWVRVRSSPSLSAPILKYLHEGQEVDVVNVAHGSTVGGDDTWYQLPSGGWVFSGLISRGRASESVSSRGGGGRLIDVNLSTQTAKAIEGGTVVYTAEVTTGKPGWSTPTGTFRIVRRAGTVNMSSATIGIPVVSPMGYYQPNVQYTQYFDNDGDALHANYWQPDYVFGNIPTSHGCVGMRTGDAAFFWNFASTGTPVVIHY